MNHMGAGRAEDKVVAGLCDDGSVFLVADGAWFCELILRSMVEVVVEECG